MKDVKFKQYSSIKNLPSGILENITLDGGRHDTIAVSETDIRLPHFVLGGDFAQLAEHPELVQRLRQLHRRTEANRFRDRLVRQLIQRLKFDYYFSVLEYFSAYVYSFCRLTCLFALILMYSDSTCRCVASVFVIKCP